ncbi:hypothetical protein ICV35_26655 [Rhodococcus ruber]|uniref:hypothetical protein n=1 Tax=Rhodococcus ruber TaxID=1830 RepID=UPI00177E7C5D|nr:hypothetical protein [Rhodococcus ruber]MBD8057221.1 hypothetical protein [Rhodococcus ruber]
MNRPSSVSTLTAGPGERVLEVLDFHVCAGEPCATVVLEPIDGCPALECCIPVEQLHVHTTGVVSSLRESGLSIRAIAAATGDSVGTIHAELSVVQNRTPAPISRELGRVADATPDAEPIPITGTDGKTYKPKPADYQNADAGNVARHDVFTVDREKGVRMSHPLLLGSQEKVPGAGNRAALVVAAALGFGLLYFLPLGLLELAVSNGWHAAAGVIAVSFLRPNGERVVLGRLDSFLEAAAAIADHTEILTLQHGEVQLVEAVAPIVTEFADGTVMHYRLEVVDQDATL